MERAALGPLLESPAGSPAREALLTAAFAALLFRWSGQDRISFALDTEETRAAQATQGTRGAGDGATARTLGAVVTEGLTSAGLADALTPADGPTAPVALRLTGTAGTTGSATANGNGTDGPYEILLAIAPDGALELHYDPELFDAVTARGLLGSYTTLVTDAARRPDTPVTLLELLPGEQLQRMLVDWNATVTPLADGLCLHEVFEARAAERPEATALVHRGEHWSFARVNSEANRLARHLRTLGVDTDVRVGLCLDRSPHFLVAVLGTLKAGGAYVPLDPDYPAQRIETMIKGSSSAVVVSTTALAASLPAAATEGESTDSTDSTDRPLVLLDRDADLLAALPDGDLGRISGPDDLCYIIHTSGSTGAPKPIALRHRGVLNNVDDLNTSYAVGPGDAALSISSPSFDLSVYEFLGLTLAGGTVVVPDAERAKEPAHWAELVAAHPITVWNSAPALLELLTDHLEQSGVTHLPALKVAILGGDWIPVTLPDRIRAIAPALRFIALGGATEASIHSTVFEVTETDPGWASIPYGRPMANQRTYLLDDHLQPVPPGVPGELFLAGTGLARGYLDQPERTAERFLDWSHGEVTDRVYRTGDLARYGHDGLIELLGRTDFQVKLNGLRVELGEIEAVLRSHPAIRQSAVVAHGSRLIAYAVPHEDHTVPVDALLALAAERLPAFMVPDTVVPLERLPLTPNGKVDRKSLPVPDPDTADYRAPAPGAEQILATVFATVLGIDRVGADDDFIALGGDSIRAIQAVPRARALGLAITPRQILQHRTVAAVAPEAEPVTDGAPGADGPPAVVGAEDLAALRARHSGLSEVWPLTPMQSGMVFESLLGDTGQDPYQMQTVYRLTGTVDGPRLRAAGQRLVDRYAALRAGFVSDSGGNLVQIVVDGVEVPWTETDLGDLTDDGRQQAYEQLLAWDRSLRFDLGAPPLLRLTLVRLGPDRADLVVGIHHALIDGWSERIIGEELLRLYAAGESGSAPGSGTVTASGIGTGPDFGAFLGWLARQDKAASAEVWGQELAALDGPTLLTPARAARSAPVPSVGELSFTLTDSRRERLATRAAALGVTVNTLVQGSWAILLGTLTGRTDVVFGATVSGRPGALAGVESMVGLFINTLPVRVGCAPGQRLDTLFTGLQERQTALLDHHHHSLSDIHQAAGVDALFDTMIAFQSFPGGDGPDPESGITLTGVESLGAATYPLVLIVEPDRMVLQYYRHLFAGTAAEEIAARFTAVLDAVADPATTQVASVDALLPGERGRILAASAAPPAEESATVTATGTGTSTGTGTGTDTATIAEYFARQAAATPDATAVTSGGESLTYRQIDRAAAALAAELTAYGMGPEHVVGIALPRSVHWATALIGTARSGAAWVLLDPAGDGSAPATAAELLVTASGAGARPPVEGTPLILLDQLRPGTAPAPATAARPAQLACLRRPQGAPGAVAVGHRVLAADALGLAERTGLASGTPLLAASPHPDDTALELLAALVSGATAELAADPAAPFGPDGWDGWAISTTAPVLAAALGRPTGPVRARTVHLTGPVLLGSLVRRIRETVPGVRVVGAYGSDGTVGALTLAANPDTGSDGTAGGLPLGTPGGGVRTYLLAPTLAPVPDGVTGELYLAGELPRGFAADPALTATRFLPDPYGEPGSRMYRTGEFARRTADGTLEYAGPGGPRAKVRGHRFWTGDVEAVLAAHPGVGQAAVVARPGTGDGGSVLTGYVVPPNPLGTAVPAEELRDFTAARLPDHMVPAAFVSLGALPLAPDGTVDRDALPEPGTGDGGPEGTGDGHRPGRTPQEEALCALFAEILGVEQVGIDDDFFALGGNSLKATRLIGRMRRNLGIDTSIRTLFEYSTIAELSGQVQATGTTKSRPRLRKMTKEQSQ
ncbi:amino acid adenylation domain-containing protein [Streptomyces sp. NPDC000594]|uniref:amino acid adenylation domain-containing protein n=1 Tax=Streptomyces sp. NPDC000594 TaxID=3154261 RepID=UPI0033337475